MVDIVKKSSAFIVIIAVFISAIFGIQQFIDSRIDKKLHSEETVNYINSKIVERLHEESTINYLDTRIEKKVHDDAITSFIDDRIDKSITTSNFIGKVKRNIKPTAIFNENGSIIANMGAMDYIADLKVIKEKYKQSKDEYKFKIILSPKEHLNVAPILEALDGRYNISSKRGHKFDWVYNLDPIITLITDSSANIDTIRFRIEILN